MVLVSTQAIANETCYSGPPDIPGTPEELISSYFVRESTHQHVHPMANSPFKFVTQVSHGSPEYGVAQKS